MNVIDTIYSKSFDELNAEQKEKAIDIMRDLERHDSDPFWAQLINEDKRELMDNEYGFTDTVIHYSGLWKRDPSIVTGKQIGRAHV